MGGRSEPWGTPHKICMYVCGDDLGCTPPLWHKAQCPGHILLELWPHLHPLPPLYQRGAGEAVRNRGEHLPCWSGLCIGTWKLEVARPFTPLPRLQSMNVGSYTHTWAIQQPGCLILLFKICEVGILPPCTHGYDYSSMQLDLSRVIHVKTTLKGGGPCR